MATPELSEQAQRYDELARELPKRFANRSGIDPLPDFAGEIFTIGRRKLNLRKTSARATANRSAVYVHGLGGSATNWTDLMHLLEPASSGIAVDLPGFGNSPMPDDRDYSIAAHTEAVIAVIEDQCDVPVDLFGNSMGGAISIRVAGMRPDLVKSLILVSPAVPSLRLRKETFGVGIATIPGPATLYEYLSGKRDPVKAVDQMHDLVYLDKSSVHPQRREQEIEQAAWRLARLRANEPLWLSYKALLATYLPKRPTNTWNFAAGVSAPTLAIFGTHDRLVDPRMAIPIARNIPGSTVLTLRTGHVAQLEHPVDVATHVLNHWAR